jgi:hypothetical protein
MEGRRVKSVKLVSPEPASGTRLADSGKRIAGSG